MVIKSFIDVFFAFDVVGKRVMRRSAGGTYWTLLYSLIIVCLHTFLNDVVNFCV